MRIKWMAWRMITAEEHEASLKESGMTKPCVMPRRRKRNSGGTGGKSASIMITANTDDARIAKVAEQAGLTDGEHQNREDEDTRNLPASFCAATTMSRSARSATDQPWW